MTPVSRIEVLSEERAATGKILCVNLTLLVSLLATPFMPSLEGRILLIEEVGEPPRKIEAHLSSLLFSGRLEKCAGVVFCNYTDCGGASVLKRVFRRFSLSAGVPVFSGVRFGHTFPSLAFVCGEDCVIEDGRLFAADGGTE